MIASHNSGTGERGKSIKDFLLTPFSKCQSKTLIEQYETGCRLFDIRINSKKHLAHGFWESFERADTVLYNLDHTCKEPTYVILTIEGKKTNDMVEWMLNLKADFENLEVIQMCSKKPTWKVLYCWKYVFWKKCFSSATWRRWIPIPWLWKKLSKKINDDEKIFTMIDFV